MRTLTYATAHDVTTLEPTQASGWADHTAALAIFGSLVLNFDGRTGNPGYFPWLAERVEPVGDLCWAIQLRENLRFHNGEPLDAAALKFSFDRILAPDFPSRRYLHSAPIERVETDGALRVLVHTSEPIAIFPARLLRADAAPVAPGLYSHADTMETCWAPIGAGPFRFVDYREGEQLVLDVNRDFKDPRDGIAPNYDRLVLKVITKVEDLLEGMDLGSVDIVPIPAEAVAAVEAKAGWRVVSGPDTSRMSFEINQAVHPALADRRVRQAINHAIDAEALCAKLTGGAGRRIASLVNPPNADISLEPYPYDADRARALLADSGYGDGFEIAIDWSTAPDRGQLAEALVPYLGEVGIRVSQVRELDWAEEYLPGQVAGTLAGLHGHGHAGVEMTAETDLWPLHPQREANSTNWRGPAADRFIEIYRQLQRTTDSQAQRALADALQRITCEEAVSVPFWQLPRFVAVGPRVAHYRPYPGGHNEDFWAIRMIDGA